MNKNLKKVISVASALAVSASSVAAFAASFPDVADTASYKQAVDELVALNIINGFDDGTFGPDQNVTRAQITKMIVTALGETAVSAAEAAAGKDTQFADVTGNHWAAGFVATGTSATASNFINGYSATQFGPEDNVTYAQAIKMLVAALGYSSYAENEGGWPNGYLKYGYSLGLNEGVSGVGNDDAATRAQVAQMIDNALKCPICVSDGYENDAWGRPVPKTVVKDGSGDLDGTKDGYQNLLNYAHDAYLVYGRVTGTFKTGACEADEVEFAVEKSDNWLGYSYDAQDEGDEEGEKVTVYKGDVTNTDANLLAYAEAILVEDDNDELTLISLTPYGATEQVELATENFRQFKGGDKYDSLEMYKDASQSKYDTYKINNEDFEVYVNGVPTDYSLADLTDEAGEDYDTLSALLVDNETGTITLVDTSDTAKSSTDGKYDYAMITKYVDAIVDYVEVDEDEAVISFETTSDGDVAELVVDFEDEDKEYNLTLNGEAISVSDLQAKDVLTVAYDVTKGFEDSDSYEVMVSRDVVEGKLKSSDIEEGEYTFDNGETYKKAWADAADLENGNSYTIYLNVFGKIAMVDDLASAKKFAILENVYDTNGGADYAATLITTEGKVNYMVDADDYDDLKAALMADDSMFDTDEKMANREAVQNRVIEYTVKTNGELNFKGVVSADADIDTKAYKASTSKLGSVKVSEAITEFIDVQEYLEDGDAVTMSYADLVDGTTYTGYAFGETGSEDVAKLVLITAGTAGLNVNSNIAVYVTSSTEDTDNGSMEAVRAYVGGELTTLLLESDDLAEDLVAGDAFFFKKNSENEVTNVYPILSKSVANTYTEFYADYVKGAKFDAVNSTVADGFAGVEGASLHFNRSKDVDECELVFGAVVANGNGEVSLVVEADDLANVNIDEAVDYDLAESVNVYVYDYDLKKAKDRVDTTSVAGIKKTTFPNSAFIVEVDANGKETRSDEIVNFESSVLNADASEENPNYGKVTLALLKVVDDEVTEAVVYVPSNSKD